MSLWSSLFGPREYAVRVAFRELHQPLPPPRLEGWYAYLWRLGPEPKRGDRIIVPGIDGPAHAVVEVLGSKRDLKGCEAKSVIALVSAEQVAAAVAGVRARQDLWLDMMRKSAGLPSSVTRRRPPEGYDPIPPAGGDAPAEAADRCAAAWARAAKLARDDEERKRFEALKYRWRAVRKQGA